MRLYSLPNSIGSSNSMIPISLASRTKSYSGWRNPLLDETLIGESGAPITTSNWPHPSMQ